MYAEADAIHTGLIFRCSEIKLWKYLHVINGWEHFRDEKVMMKIGKKQEQRMSEEIGEFSLE